MIFSLQLSEQKNSKNQNRQKTERNLNESLSANSSRSWQKYLTQKGTSTNAASQERSKKFSSFWH